MASKESKRDSKREREDRTEEKESKHERTDDRKSKHNGSSRREEGERSSAKTDAKASAKAGEKSAKKVKDDRPKETKAKEAKPSETKVSKDAKQEPTKRRFKEAAAPEADAKPKAVKASKSEPEKKKARTSEKEKPPSKPAKPAKAESKGKSEKSAREEKAAKPDDADKVAKITLKPSPSPSPSPEKVAPNPQAEARSRRSSAGGGACAAEALDDAASSGSSSAGSSASSRRQRQKDREKERKSSSFSATLVAPPAPPPPGAAGLMQPPQLSEVSFGPPPETSLVPLALKVQGLLDNQQSIAQEMARMKQVMGGVAKEPVSAGVDRGENKEATLKMPSKLTENLLHPDNEAQLLARTGLQAAMLNGEGHVVLRADSAKSLQKAMGQLRRVAYHCQWGCSKEKVAALLQEKPTRPVHTMVCRLAATSSRLQSFELRLNSQTPKLRIGSDRASCQMVAHGCPGVSRKHCTLTFEPEKGAVYVQDLSTNGTYFNGKRLPRPPYKNPQDARVRVFHGDELFFKLREKDAEELGYIINLMELS